MKKMIVSLLVVPVSLAALTANADVVYQQVVSGTYGQAFVNTGSDYAGLNISVDGAGAARLVTYYHTPGDGYKLWYGTIPSSAVKVEGINSIAVQIDTCTVNPIDGCAPVDAVVTMDPKAGGFITDGSTHYTWDNVILQVAGPTQVRNANATGSINGIPLDGARAYTGKYNTASIEVQTNN